MAIYHLSAKIIGRAQGKSAVAAAAYRASETLHSQHQDVVFDYSKKRGVEFSEIMLPSHAPAWMLDREKLWNAVELFEKRKDATYAREVEVSLPVELSLEQQKSLLRDYINENFVKLGMVADYSIHDQKSHNPHAHIMLTLRPVIEEQFGNKAREWNDKKLFEQWREQWAALTNIHLALAGVDKKISHLSYADQGIDLEPTMHRGYLSNENREILDRFQQAKAIKARNYEHLLQQPETALDILTNKESVFSHHELARFVNERTDSTEEFLNLKYAVECSHQLVSLGQGLDGKEYYTSINVLQNEQDLIQRATRLAKSNIHQLNPHQFDFVLASRTLTDEQKAAFDHILSSNDLSLIVGFAGTGKSYLMDAVREAYEAKGYHVVGAALAGRAADGLMQSARIDSRTIDRFLIDWQNGRARLTNKTVLIIDEIGMVGTKKFQALLAEAELAGAKVIGCGDPEQIPPVEAGCPFRYLLERIDHVYLKNVVRQRTEWQRQATIELSTHQHAKALERYNEHGCIHAHRTRQEAMTTMVDRWYTHYTKQAHSSAVMMAYRNADVLAMNLLARERLQADQQLGIESIVIPTTTYGELTFNVGDKIMFLRNESSLNVRNGLAGKIEHIDNKMITVKLDRGDTLSFDSDFYRDLGYGYASTIHKLQGETVDQSFVLATTHLDRYLTNVAMDRHRHNVELHYGQDDFATFDNLKRTLSRGASKILAVEFCQSRGIDYEEQLDKAAMVESKHDFSTYYEQILNEGLPIQHTLAETYLKKQGIEDIDISSVRFHPGIWEKETQTYMPALIAKAVGQSDVGLEAKGVQVTFLDQEGNKADIDHPVRYSGSPNAIIMLQKPAEKDHRWYLAADLETGLAITKANTKIRVACLATQEKFDKNPLQGGHQKELIFCAGNSVTKDTIEKAHTIFSKQGFAVSLSQSNQVKNFAELLKAKGNLDVQRQLASTQVIKTNKRIEAVINQAEIEL